MLQFFACALFFLFSQVNSETSNWAVLVAGSNGYYNYRHQSDISHAYQILTKLGKFPADNIITMMYDDIAYNRENPFPGKIFNEPGGKDVYQGVKIDYKGDDVTAKNFMAVLKGDSETTKGKKVLRSTSEDKVFVYFADHGGVHLIAFPVGPYLYADELHQTLLAMKGRNMYKELVFYMEACESGSMFDKLLPSNLEIFATTAANPSESSYAFYYNQSLETYMADEYSIRWMQDSTKNWGTSETLRTQFLDVKKVVKKSHPQQYGNTDIENEPITNFEAFKDSLSEVDKKFLLRVKAAVPNLRIVSLYSNQLKKSNEMYGRKFNPQFVPSEKFVSSRNVKLMTLQLRWLKNKDAQKKLELERKIKSELELRERANFFFKRFVQNLGVEGEWGTDLMLYGYLGNAKNLKCLKESIEMFERNCFKFNDYSLQFAKTLNNACQVFGEKQVLGEITKMCIV